MKLNKPHEITATIKSGSSGQTNAAALTLKYIDSPMGYSVRFNEFFGVQVRAERHFIPMPQEIMENGSLYGIDSALINALKDKYPWAQDIVFHRIEWSGQP